jgi:hypothetical protein
MESFSSIFVYRNRAGSRVVRPERIGSEIGLSSAFRMRFDDCVRSLVKSVLSESCVALLSDRDSKSFEFTAV